MKHVSTSTGDQLTHALHMLGVNFILGGKDTNESLHKQPARLISALAQSDEARLRLSLIPLFLEHPEYASHVCDVVKGLAPSARLTLRCYYSAAVWLQRKYRLESRLNPISKTKKESPRWSNGQTPGFVGCLSCFQLYPFIVVKVNVFVNELLRFFKGGFFELS